MAPIEAAKVDAEVPPAGDTKQDSKHLEDAESGIKLTQFDGERVIVTEQDVSPSSQCPYGQEVISPANSC